MSGRVRWGCFFIIIITSLRFTPASALLLCFQPPIQCLSRVQSQSLPKKIPWGCFHVPVGLLGQGLTINVGSSELRGCECVQ